MPEAAGAEHSTPRAVATAWVDAVMDRGDLGAAWRLTDPTLRLVLAQHWVFTHSHDPAVGGRDGWDGLARGLAAWPSAHPLWDRFATDRVGRWREFWAGFNTRTWSIRDRHEPLGDDLEVVSFVETGGGGRPKRPVARRLAVRRTAEGWLVAGLDGSALSQPGWPPTQIRPPTPPPP